MKKGWKIWMVVLAASFLVSFCAVGRHAVASTYNSYDYSTGTSCTTTCSGQGQYQYCSTYCY